MGTYSNTIGVKIESAVNTGRNSDGTFFTNASDEYTIFSIYFDGNQDNCAVRVGGRIIAEYTGTSNQGPFGPIYAGPSATVELINRTQATVNVVGTTFKNNP